MAKKTKPTPEVVANPERDDDMPEITVTAIVRLKITNTPNARRGSIFMCSSSAEVRHEDGGGLGLAGTMSLNVMERTRAWKYYRKPEVPRWAMNG